MKCRFLKVTLLSVVAVTFAVASCSDEGKPPTEQCPVGETLCNEVCVNTQNDRNNCGDCGVVCSSNEVCENGTCVSVGCPEGQTECNGVCTNTNYDPNNCGFCGNACGEGETCIDGRCSPRCQEGLTECDGRCVDTLHNPEHCGECNHVCEEGQVCNNGVCTGGSCPPGQTECPEAGCVDLRNDPENCGECGHRCDYACVDGACVGECPAGLTLCSGMCVDLSKDEENCGSCGNICNEGEVCEGSVCVLHCPEGLTNCDGECVDTQNNPDHCGSCGHSCVSGEVCVEGSCTSGGCPSPLVECNGVCVDTTTDENNCGGCGNTCSAGQSCVDGSCQIVCPEGQTLCGERCVDTNSDENNCGSCGNTCRTDQICSSGSCTCPGALIECNGVCVDTSIDRNNCGSCGNTCTGSEACVEGTCTLECPSGLTACGGYCVDTDTDRNNCGRCGNVCEVDTSCVAGSCVPAICPADSCSDPIDVSGGGRFTGSTECAGDDYSGSCGGSYGREIVFTFTLTNPQDVFITTYGSSFDTVLYIREGVCDTGSDIYCNDDEKGTTQSELKLLNLAPGTYYLFLDGYFSSDYGDYVLNIYMTDPRPCWWGRIAGDRCGDPIYLDLSRLTSSGDSESVSGHTCPLSWCDPYPDTEGCRGWPEGKDVVYYFILTSTTTLTFSLCDTASWDTVMYVRESCIDRSSEVVCDDDGCPIGLQSTFTQTFDPGIYFLWIDGYDESACGSYTLTVSR